MTRNHVGSARADLCKAKGGRSPSSILCQIITMSVPPDPLPLPLPPPAPGIPEDFWFKNRLQEFTQKASIPLPVYETSSEGVPHAPRFRSQVWVDGTCFASRSTFSNRKMAEQDAAKHALIGIQEKVKNEGSLRVLQSEPLEDSAAISLVNKRKEIDVGEGSSTDPFATISKSSSVAPLPAIQLMIPESTPEQLSNTQVVPQFLHEFKKPKSQTSLPAVAPPIVFVPPASEQAVISSTSGKKRNRKNKKTKKKSARSTSVNNPLDSSEPPCFLSCPNEQLTPARYFCPIPSTLPFWSPKLDLWFSNSRSGLIPSTSSGIRLVPQELYVACRFFPVSGWSSSNCFAKFFLIGEDCVEDLD
ncbi:hypothetical protein Sango_0085500 [Sesamum angolense]|uniref:DRBM domain-containing protein n=1 Tax=Sesamum angolense TaxID=2727404 RepID=A0AAE1XE30_9LAMI|nr:hypothetical protein Sango_0085500 [Sesamum angolense]